MELGEEYECIDDVVMNPASTKEEKQAAYDWLRELFTILLPDE